MHKIVCKIVESAISKVKPNKYNELYDRLKNQEGVKYIFRHFTVRDKRSRDFQNIKCKQSEDKRD